MLKKKELSELSRYFQKDWTVARLRITYEKIPAHDVVILDSCDAYQVLSHMWDSDLINIQEQFSAIFLDYSHKVIAYRNITTGITSECPIDINLLLASALNCRASRVIIAHNHPTGDTSPSEQDKRTTVIVGETLNLFDIELFDHLIISEDDFFSFSEYGLELLKN